MAISYQAKLAEVEADLKAPHDKVTSVSREMQQELQAAWNQVKAREKENVQMVQDCRKLVAFFRKVMLRCSRWRRERSGL